MTSRRKFLARTAGALGAWSMLDLDSLYAAPPAFATFDFHSHPGAFYSKGATTNDVDAAAAKTLREGIEGGLTGAFFSLVADAPILQIGPTGVTPKGNYESGQAWKEYKRQLSILKEYVGAFATQGNDMAKALKAGKTAAYLSIEGGDFLEGNPSLLDEMYADGVRSIQLVHYHPNELGNLQTEPAQYQGLSDAGKEVVKKMNRMGMVVDVAHAAESTVKAVVDITDQPIILSHSVLNVDNNRPLAKRTISPEHAKLIAKTKGVIGAWPSGYNTSFDDFIDNIKKMVDLVGVDHVGLGTDMDGNFKPVLSSYLELNKWHGALKAKGFSESEVKKIAGGNAERVLKAVLR